MIDMAIIQPVLTAAATDVKTAVPAIIGFVVLFMVARKLIGLFS